MKINPLFKWFGSKWQSAKRYPIPMGNIIVEPYAGGAGYSLNHCDKLVHIWDDDPNISKLWKWLINEATKEEILEIPVGLSVGTRIDLLGLTEGQKLLLKHWQRTNNVGDCWTISPWGDKPGQWTLNTRVRVANEVSAIKHWKFTPPIDIIDTPSTWFIDPPYQYNYKYRTSLPKFDYLQLEKFIQTIHNESLVIACEARCPKTGKAPDYLEFIDNHSSVTSRRKKSQSHHSKELVYIRFPKHEE